MNALNEDMKVTGVTVEDAEDRVGWRKLVHRGTMEEILN